LSVFIQARQPHPLIHETLAQFAHALAYQVQRILRRGLLRRRPLEFFPGEFLRGGGVLDLGLRRPQLLQRQRRPLGGVQVERVRLSE